MPTNIYQKKVAIYIRVSTKMQIEKDSLQVQKRELIGYSEFVLGINDYEVFEDPGYSAKNTDRPAYQQMMLRLHSGEFSHLLVWKLDRISRNLIDFATLYQTLKDLGIVFVSKNEQFDTSSAMGEAMLKIVLVFAELERKMTAERVSAVMLSRANNGQWNGGKVPFGYSYSKETKTFSINEAEKDIYHIACDKYEEMQSILFTVRWLNQNGYRTRNEKDWSTTGLHKILTNVFYLGKYRYNVRDESNASHIKKPEDEWITIDDHHPPLISEEQFYRIQALLKKNQRGYLKPGDTYIKKNIHIFGGLIRCDLCGSNMISTTRRRYANGWQPSMYNCSSRRKYHTCQNKFLSDSVAAPFTFSLISAMMQLQTSGKLTTESLKSALLDQNAFKSVTDITFEPENILSVLGGKPVIDKPSLSEETISEKAILESQRKKYETALKRLNTLYLYGDEGMSEKDFILEKTKITSSLDEITAKIESLAAESSGNLTVDEAASFLLMSDQFLNYNPNGFIPFIKLVDKEMLKQFITRLIDEIRTADGKITRIRFKSGLCIIFKY